MGPRRGAGLRAPWLPEGKSCAINFSIDDVHPAASDREGYDAGGDLAAGMLGHVLWLAERHPDLRTTLAVTPDWRPRAAGVTRRMLAALPFVGRRCYLTHLWEPARLRLDRHPEFCRFIASLPGVEIVPHGVHHIRRGQPTVTEFETATSPQCEAILAEAARIMNESGLAPACGHSPPGWAAPRPFRQAVRAAGLAFITSARDIDTPITPGAVTAGSGLKGQPLCEPGLTTEGLVHIPANFQATSSLDRAMAILEAGGLLTIKAHAIKVLGNYRALDGLDRDYAVFLDRLFAAARDRFGDAIWWASMQQISDARLAAQTGATAA